MIMAENLTYAEVMASNLQKIVGEITQELIMLYVQKRTHLSRKDIQAVFDSIAELNQKVKKKTS
jgi:hypothetical protein